MGNAWTRLLQETSKHGGPQALRQHYANAGAAAGKARGRVQGYMLGVAVPLVGAGAGWVADKALSMVLDRKNALQPEAKTAPKQPSDRCDHRCEHDDEADVEPAGTP